LACTLQKLRDTGFIGVPRVSYRIGSTGVLVAVLMLTGCTVGPDYATVDPDLPETWNTGIADNTTLGAPGTAHLATWWTTLGDPMLDELIALAVSGNQDLRLAQARVREARARRGISAAALWPTVDPRVSATHSRTSENSVTFSVPSGPGGSALDFEFTNDLYALGFDASWELDVFGGTRRGIEAADADIETREAEQRDILVTLLAEVALNYLELRTAQQRLEVARANLDSQEKTYELTRWRRTAGLATQLDVEQARSILAQSQATEPGLETAVKQSKNRLAVLVGVWPGTLDDELSTVAPLPVPSLQISVGVPADTIRRRPDVRAAERRLAAQTAQIGVATADLYPRFSLLGSIGLESLSTDNLFDAGSNVYKIGPSVSWRMFDAGAIRANIQVQTALQEQALIEYESTVLAVLEEVENALIAYAQERVRQDTLREAVEAADRAADLSRNEYEAGLVDFQTVLDAQRTRLNVEDQLAASAGEVISNLVRLYKALGGGWESFFSASTPRGQEVES
jgi:NodT family efflux transporter outer membrane factor (OMF) lipoprotein